MRYRYRIVLGICILAQGAARAQPGGEDACKGEYQEAGIEVSNAKLIEEDARRRVELREKDYQHWMKELNDALADPKAGDQRARYQRQVDRALREWEEALRQHRKALDDRTKAEARWKQASGAWDARLKPAFERAQAAREAAWKTISEAARRGIDSAQARLQELVHKAWEATQAHALAVRRTMDAVARRSRAKTEEERVAAAVEERAADEELRICNAVLERAGNAVKQGEAAVHASEAEAVKTMDPEARRQWQQAESEVNRLCKPAPAKPDVIP
jgi:hypothetical protein